MHNHPSDLESLEDLPYKKYEGAYLLGVKKLALEPLRLKRATQWEILGYLLIFEVLNHQKNDSKEGIA